MDNTNQLTGHLKKAEASSHLKQAAQCPVCWGYQEYDRFIKKMYWDKQVDVNNHRQKYMLIQEFVVNKIDGITLRKAEKLCVARERENLNSPEND